MAFTNSQILSAVLARWMRPVIMQLAKGGLSQFPFVRAIETQIRNLGWVGVNWSLADELSPFASTIVDKMLEPMIANKLSSIPDANIPTIANAIVDDAISQGKLSLFDGKIEFSLEDLQELKNLLHYNLKDSEAVPHYQVLTKGKEK